MAENTEGSVDSNSSKTDKTPEFRFSRAPSLEDIRVMQSRFAAERDWEQFHTPRNLLLALVGEVGELSEIL
ncbi:dCTP pyrophosphatase 1 [Geodia barretti]|uniref:dCTP pyrophosphatase 1 n=1 Tax=Geodia barretti TaxID=519541 RepID=A0AA35T9T0_GEOBA|nr:dCTP pyrophosphatase 1 [Geodia barretti]